MRYTTTTREESVLSWVRRLARNGEGMRLEIGDWDWRLVFFFLDSG